MSGRIRPRVMWVVSYGDGDFDPLSVRRTRRAAIAAFLDYPGGNNRWDHWRKQGCRAVKVRISEVSE